MEAKFGTAYDVTRIKVKVTYQIAYEVTRVKVRITITKNRKTVLLDNKSGMTYGMHVCS